MAKKKAIAKNSIVCGTYYLSARKEADKSSETIGYYVHGTELEVLETDGEWSRVLGADKWGAPLVGWVLNKYLE